MTNGYEKYGYFDYEKKEFVITNSATPRPWLNYAWNLTCYSAIDQRGTGCFTYRDSEGNRSELLKDRFIYIKDLADNEFWTVGWGKICKKEAIYNCRHGLGYSVITCLYKGISVKWTITVSENSCEVWEICVENLRENNANIAVYAGIKFSLGGWEPYGSLENFAEAYPIANNILYAHNRSNERPNVRNDGYFAISQKECYYELSEITFLGDYYRNYDQAQGVIEPNLSNSSAMNENMTGIFQYNLNLDKGSQNRSYCVAESVFSESDLIDINQKTTADFFNQALLFAKKKTAVFDRIKLELPDKEWSHFFDVWGKQQLAFVKDFARLFLMGFRDTLQDAMAYCAYNPKEAGKSILTTLRYQLSDGSCLRGWCPLDTHKYGDSGVWIAMAIAEFLKESGDSEFLQIEVPYYDGGSATVADHLAQSLRFFEENAGAHGLPKLFFGDWNDSLNIGRKGNGESVWLAMALVKAYEDAAEIASFAGDEALAASRKIKAENMRTIIDRTCWDGEWYLRGFDDDGNKIGSKECENGKIFSEPQSWCVLAKLNPEHIKTAQKSVDKYLRTPNGLMVCYPPYQKYQANVGRISCMAPGWGENGSCYCHASAFQVTAEAMLHDADKAFETLESIMPFHSKLNVDISRLEPYAFSNMFRGPNNLRSGETFKGWTSGTVAWAQRAMTHYLLGIRSEFNGLRIDPVLPADYKFAKVNRIFRNTEFEITMTASNDGCNDKKLSICIDGEFLEDNLITNKYFDGKKHIVKVIF